MLAVVFTAASRLCKIPTITRCILIANTGGHHAPSARASGPCREQTARRLAETGAGPAPPASGPGELAVRGNPVRAGRTHPARLLPHQRHDLAARGPGQL